MENKRQRENQWENAPPLEQNSQSIFRVQQPLSPLSLPQIPSRSVPFLPAFSSQSRTESRVDVVDVFKKHADWHDGDQGNPVNGDFTEFPRRFTNQTALYSSFTEQKEAHTKRSLPLFHDFLGNPFLDQHKETLKENQLPERQISQQSQQWNQGLGHTIPFQQNTFQQNMQNMAIWNDTKYPFLDDSKDLPIPYIPLQDYHQTPTTTLYPTTNNGDGTGLNNNLGIICECCHIYKSSYELNPCKHLLCNLCTQAHKKDVRFNAYQTPISFKCPLCQVPVLRADSLLGHSIDFLPARPLKSQSHSTRPLSETAHFVNPIVSIGNQMLLPANVSLPKPVEWPVVKISNIPWDCSQKDMRKLLDSLQFPPTSIHAQSIHILMDRMNGKTLSEAFIEMGSEIDAIKALEKTHKPLKGRMVTISRSSQEELMARVFPKWKGTFISLNAIAPSVDAKNSTSSFQSGPAVPPLVTRDEASYILVVCRSFKLHFSRKCAERPFEQVISILTKMPWHQPQIITTMHRDHLFEMLKISIEYLINHLQKDYTNIDETLMVRLVSAGLMVPMFTDRQKNLLISLSQIHCPPELAHYLSPPLCLVSSSSIANSGNELIVQQLKSLNLSQPLPHANNRAVLGELTNNNMDNMEQSSLSNTLVRQVQQVARVGSKLHKVNPKAVPSAHRFGQSKESNQISNEKHNFFPLGKESNQISSEKHNFFPLGKENIDPRVKNLL